LPNPAAEALPNISAETTAALSNFKLNEIDFGLVFNRIFCDIDSHSIGMCCVCYDKHKLRYRCYLSFLWELSQYHHGLTQASATILATYVKPAKTSLRAISSLDSVAK
jgi:hypothetical protein